MTREEAIRIFRKEIECMSHTKCSDCILEKVCDPISTTPLDSEYIEAFGMAIESLSAEPCEDCEDCISRQAVLDIVDSYSGSRSNVEDVTQDIISDIMALSTVTPKQKMGHWIEHNQYGIVHLECSECSVWFLRAYLIRNSYCPNCGAKMSENPTGSNCTDCVLDEKREVKG